MKRPALTAQGEAGKLFSLNAVAPLHSVSSREAVPEGSFADGSAAIDRNSPALTRARFTQDSPRRSPAATPDPLAPGGLRCRRGSGAGGLPGDFELPLHGAGRENRGIPGHAGRGADGPVGGAVRGGGGAWRPRVQQVMRG